MKAFNPIRLLSPQTTDVLMKSRHLRQAMLFADDGRNRTLSGVNVPPYSSTSEELRAKGLIETSSKDKARTLFTAYEISKKTA
jgi:hypothetical protein